MTLRSRLGDSDRLWAAVALQGEGSGYGGDQHREGDHQRGFVGAGCVEAYAEEVAADRITYGVGSENAA